jgi:hypothetical protein
MEITLNDSQSREAVKYSHETAGLGIKNDCPGEGQQQFALPMDWVFKGLKHFFFEKNIKINLEIPPCPKSIRS